MSPHVPARTRISISECLLFSNYRSSRGSSQQSSLSLPHALAPPPDILSLQHIFSLSSGDCSAPSYCPAAIATHPVGATPLSLMLSPSPSPPLVEPTASMPSRPPLPLLATPPSFPRAENPRLQRCNCAQEGAEVCLQATQSDTIHLTTSAAPSPSTWSWPSLPCCADVPPAAAVPEAAPTQGALPPPPRDEEEAEEEADDERGSLAVESTREEALLTFTSKKGVLKNRNAVTNTRGGEYEGQDRCVTYSV